MFFFFKFIYRFLLFFSIFLWSSVSNSIVAQSNQQSFQNDSLKGEVINYNLQRDVLEGLLRQAECESELIEARDRFLEELNLLDSLFAIIDFRKIPQYCTENNLLIVSNWQNGNECIYVSYERTKYRKGCQVPFYTDSVKWDKYEHLKKAKIEGRLCVETFQFSGYTQVEKLPETSLDEESAANLLNQIQRTLKVYRQKLDVTFEDYLAYEKSKDVKTIDEEIFFRTAFLNMCIKKIKQ